MAGRFRARVGPSTWRYHAYGGSNPAFNDGPYIFAQEQHNEVFVEGSYPGSNSCVHVKRLPVTGTYIWKSSESSWSNVSIDGLTPIISHLDPIGSCYGSNSHLIASKLQSLNWGKLPTSSEFGIIQILAELDDTIAIFTKKFWKQLSYGSFTWGVVPFVNDLRALLQTIANLSVDLASISYEDEYTVRDVTEFDSKTYRASCDLKVRFSGFVDATGLNSEAQFLLDRLGFHPDLATVWDLIPLSFIVDYVLPVGDFLESITRTGWVTDVTFTGWRTIKGRCSYAYKTPGVLSTYTPEHAADIFIRNALGNYTLSVTKETSYPSLEIPSPTQLFNMFYIARQNRR